MWEDFAINVGLSALFMALKNPKKVAKLKRALVKLHAAIEAAIPELAG